MAATLLSFARPQRPGWSNDELAQFARIVHLLGEAGVAVETDRGETDEGDPWCVFCSTMSGDVIIHVAAIEGEYVFDSAVLSAPIRGRSLDDCARRFMAEIALPLRAHHSSKIMIHPSAMLAGVVLTILLCLEMIDGEAHAAALAGGAPADGADALAEDDAGNGQAAADAAPEESGPEDSGDEEAGIAQAIRQAIQKGEQDRLGALAQASQGFGTAFVIPNIALMVAIAYFDEVLAAEAAGDGSGALLRTKRAQETGDRPDEADPRADRDAARAAPDAPPPAAETASAAPRQSDADPDGVRVAARPSQPMMEADMDGAAIRALPARPAAPAPDLSAGAAALGAPAETPRAATEEAAPVAAPREGADHAVVTQLLALLDETQARQRTVLTVEEAAAFAAAPAPAVAGAQASPEAALGAPVDTIDFVAPAAPAPGVPAPAPAPAAPTDFADLLSAFVGMTGAVRTLFSDGDVFVYDMDLLNVVVDPFTPIGVHTQTLADDSEVTFVGYVDELDAVFG